MSYSHMICHIAGILSYFCQKFVSHRVRVWPGGMRGAIKSAAPRRGARRVLNFLSILQILILEGHRACRFPLPNVRTSPSVFIPFLFFLPILFFYNFLTFSLPFLPVSDPPQCSDLLRIPYDLEVFHVAKKLDLS